MVVSIIICTRNRSQSLRETLASIGCCTVPPDLPTELIIVDNGSSDETPAVVKSAILNNMPVRLVYEPRQGKGYACNTGMASAAGEIFLFTDDDVRGPEDWIEDMCRPILAAEADAVQGIIRPAPHLERDWLRGIYRLMLAIVEPVEGSVCEGLVGANMAFGRHVLSRVEGFCTELGPGASGLGEDTLLGMQLVRAGYRLQYARGCGVEHHFDVARLNSEYFYGWVRKAGESNAIMSVRWLGNAPRRPRLVWAWNVAEYVGRRAFDWRRAPVPPEWCMYSLWRRAYASKCAELLREPKPLSGSRKVDKKSYGGRPESVPRL